MVLYRSNVTSTSGRASIYFRGISTGVGECYLRLLMVLGVAYKLPMESLTKLNIDGIILRSTPK